jgi:hypothetical protein
MNEAPDGGLRYGEACVDNSESYFKSGPQSIFDNAHGKIHLVLGLGELYHVVCSPCRSKADTEAY